MIHSRLVPSLLAGLLVLGLSGCKHHHASAAPSAPAVVPAASPLSSPSAVALAGQLGSGTDDGVRAALALPSGQALDPHAAAQLRALGPISFDLATFTYLDATTATVGGRVAHPPAGQPDRWTFTLTYAAGSWRLADAQAAG